MTELYIENQYIDINEIFSMLLSKAVADVKDFGAKSTTFSKTVILPGSKRNNAAFGHIFSVTRQTEYSPAQDNIGQNFNAAIGAKAIAYSDNIQIFKGVVRMLEIIDYGNGEYEYEMAFFGELGGLVAALGNKKIEELDFSAHDHDYTLTNIVNSWDSWNAGAGYYYPLIDYGAVSTNKHDYQYTALRPALFVREFVDKIITGAGYTYDCAFMDTDLFKRLIVPHGFKAMRSLVDTNYVNAIKSSSQSFSGVDTNVTFGTNTLNNFTLVSGYKYRHDGATAITTKCKLTIAGTYTSLSPKLRILIQKYGSTYEQVEQYLPNSHVVGDTFSITMELNATFALNDYVQIKINDSSGTSSGSITSATLSVDKEPAGLIELLIGDGISVNNNLPKNIYQKDFLSSVFKMFYMMVDEDKDKNKHLIIKPYPDYYNTTEYVDWSNKVDRSKPRRFKPMSELNARFYQFKFKSDNDFYNDQYRKAYGEGYGDRIYDNGYEFAKETNTVELIFSNTPLLGYDGEDKVVPTIFKKSGTTEEGVDSNIRIMQAKKVTGVTSWNILNGATVLGSYTNYPYAGHLDDPDAPNADISFGAPKELYFTLVSGNLANNLFNAYYSGYMAEITDVDSKLMLATVRLSRKDFNELDFSKFIYIDGGLFRLNKIIDYNATKEDTCTVELLKVINTVY